MWYINGRYNDNACLEPDSIMIWNGNIYAFSGQYLYRADVNSQRFFVSGIPLPEGTTVTAFAGTTTDGRALLAAGDTMYSLVLPH